MRFDKTTIRVLVRKDYGVCFDFYTKKLGLVPVYGDRNGPYTSFAIKEGESPCFAIFAGANMAMYKGYTQPDGNTQPDTIVAIIPSEDLESDYRKLKEADVEFIGEPQFIAEWGMSCVYFRDPEGNLFELMNGESV